MMNSCKVFVVNESLSKDDVSFATKPKVQLRAVPLGIMKRQIVKSLSNFDQDIFSVYEASSNLPADITGMAIFLAISKGREIVAEIKGKINSDIKGMVSFNLSDVEVGFYNYEVCVKASGDYYQNVLSGSYVVQA